MNSEEGQSARRCRCRSSLVGGRLVVKRPLLTDHVARALLALAPPEC